MSKYYKIFILTKDGYLEFNRYYYTLQEATDEYSRLKVEYKFNSQDVKDTTGISCESDKSIIHLIFPN